MESQFPVLCSTQPLKSGSEKFQRIAITANIFKLGRGHRNTVVIPYKCLSRDHCIFKKLNEDWILENCSYSSIKVNGNKLRKGETRKLCDKDVIKLESTNELIYTFMSSKNSKRKRRKLVEENDNSIQKKETRSHTNAKVGNLDTQMKLQDEIKSEQSRKEKEIYDEYAVRIDKVKGRRKNVKNQKSLLKLYRNKQLELLRLKMEEKMASLLAQQNTESNKETKHSKEKSKQIGRGDQNNSKEELDRLEAKREQDRLRAEEKKELKKLRRETRKLKLDKEKELKVLEKQKLRREKELQNELNKVNKKLAKERELHEKEKRRVEQLLNQKKEELKKVPPSTSAASKLDMECELRCSICSELFVRATTLGCSHSYCRYCIRKWTQNKRECPICRAPITSECRSIVLDSLVDKMAATEHAKRKRQELVKARDELEAKIPPRTLDRQNLNIIENLFNLIPAMADDNSDTSSSVGRESLLEAFDMVMDTDSEASDFDNSSDISTISDNFENGELDSPESPENYDENEGDNSGAEYNVDGYFAESDNEPEGEYGEAPPENYEEAENSAEEDEDHDGDSTENYGHDENYEESENSPSENDEQEDNEAEDYNEGENSAPESYEEGEHSASENYGGDSANEDFDGENSTSENYDEPELSEPENYDELEHSDSENFDDPEPHSEPENYDEPEHSETENYDEPEHSEPENYDEPEPSEPEDYDEPEPSEPENYDEPEPSEPENYDEPEPSEPENYDEPEHSEPENYDEPEHWEPENYDGESAPEYDLDSNPDEGEDYDDYY